MSDSPLLEFDPDRSAIIEPSHLVDGKQDVPNGLVITWMADAFERLIGEHDTTVRHHFRAETADFLIYEVDLGEQSCLAALSHVGAPVSVILYEIMVALGCTTSIAVGSSGGLVAEHPPGTVVVPTEAIRDEGTSHHYAPPARTATPALDLQDELSTGLKAEGFDVIGGTVWTTDAFFRETKERVASRIAEGAVAVDMEMSALCTVAEARGVRHGHAIYMADTLHGDEWDPTELVNRDTDFRYRLLLAGAKQAATA